MDTTVLLKLLGSVQRELQFKNYKIASIKLNMIVSEIETVMWRW